MKAATAGLMIALGGCATLEGSQAQRPADGLRIVEVAVFDLKGEALPGAEDPPVAAPILVLENVQPEHRPAIELAFGKSHPQAFDRIADLGVVVRAKGQLVRVEPLELGLQRRELLLVIDTPAQPGSMFHAARPNTDPYWDTEELLVFDPRLGRVVVSPDSRKVFVVFPLRSRVDEASVPTSSASEP